MSNVCIAAGHVWGEFQSLAQLAVATNGAFAVLAGFIATDVTKEKKEIDRIREVINRRRTIPQAVLISTRNIPLSAYVQSLAAECDHIERADFLLSVSLRPFYVLGSLMGFALLVASSFYYKLEVDILYVVFLLLANLPIVVGLVLLIYIYSKTYWARRKRSNLESALASV
jgi:hypothetical protein